MIGRLTGTFGGMLRDGTVIVDVGGVGYAVRVPMGALPQSPTSGSPLSLYIHTAVREDAIDLYGFAAENELSFFKLLTSVSGVGPKTALGILNIADVESLKRAVAHGDASVLTKVYGIGKKSAERIIVELRDKLANEAKGSPDIGIGMSADVEVLEALQALGYSAAESRKALQSLENEDSSLAGAGLRERLAAALKHLGAPPSKII